MPGPATPAETTLLCNDEDIAIRAFGDFVTLAPRNQQLAYGIDGVILAASPWVLTSTSVNFENNRVALGHMIRLTKPAATFGGSGVLMAVSSVSANTITLRNQGMVDGEGSPPVIADTSVIEFRILTFKPQIDRATYTIRNRYAIDDTFPGSAMSQIYDINVLRDIVALTVLRNVLLTDTRSQKSDLAMKLEEYTNELNELHARCQIRYGNAVETRPATTFFGMHYGR